MFTVLVFSKKPNLLQNLFVYSELFGLKFCITNSQESLLTDFVRYKPKLFIYECTNLQQNSLKFMHKLQTDIPIFAISNSLKEGVAIQAFKNGAQYFLRLPCGSMEFYYHLTNFIKLTNLSAQYYAQQILSIGNLKIYLQNHQVIQDNEFIPLTNTEYKLLMLLVNKLNDTVSTNELYKAMYSSEELKYTSRVLQMHISKLRKKLKINEASPLKLKTIHGTGYCLSLHNQTAHNPK